MLSENVWLFEAMNPVGPDQYMGFVVAAPTEERAKEIVTNRITSKYPEDNQRIEDFLCRPLTPPVGYEGIILDSFNAG